MGRGRLRNVSLRRGVDRLGMAGEVWCVPDRQVWSRYVPAGEDGLGEV